MLSRRLGLIAPAALILISFLLIPTLGRETSRVGALPPGGTDTLTVTGTVTASSRLGVETIDLVGFITVVRQDPHMDGGVEVVDTEITELELRGTSLTCTEPDCILISQSADFASTGEIRSLQPPPDQFPASTFFDIFVDVSVPASGFGTGSKLVLHNLEPAASCCDVVLRPRADGSEVSISEWPPIGAKYQLDPVYEFDNDGDTMIDEDSADEDGDGLVDEDRPGPDPVGSCGFNADCDDEEGEDPPFGLCAENNEGEGTPCDDDGDTVLDEDPDCVPLVTEGGSHKPAGLCIRDISLTVTGTGTPTPTTSPVPTSTRTPTPTATPEGIVGDANCNREVNAIDATIILQFAAGLLSSLPCGDFADANLDGAVNAIDAALILQFVAGLIDELPPPAPATPTSEPTQSPTRTLTPTLALPTATPTPDPFAPENPSYSVAPGGPSGIHPSDILGLAGTGGPVDVSGNDDFADAWQILALPFTGQQNTDSATTEPDEPLNPAVNETPCIMFGTDPQKGKTVWYRYTPSASTTLTASTVGSSFDTVLAAYSGASVDALTPVACNDDAVSLQSEITFPAAAGTTYYVQVGGYDDAANAFPPGSGDLVLDISTGSGSGAGESGLVAISCPALAFVADGCDDGSDGDQDDIDALSYGSDFDPGPFDIAFSVGPGSQGLVGTGVRAQADCSPAQPQADEFGSKIDGSNELVIDGDGEGGACPGGASLGLVETPTSDDLDALNNQPPASVDPEGDGPPLNVPVYFSLAPDSPTLAARSAGPADVMWTLGPPFQPSVYASASTLGLAAEDDIDALCVQDFGEGLPAFDSETDTVYVSLAPGSPSLATLGASAADVIEAGPDAVVVYSAAELGLDSADNLDAMKCFTQAEPSGRTGPATAGLGGCDGTQSAIDAALHLQVAAGLLDVAPCAGSADGRSNARMDAVRAALILRAGAGLIERPPA